MNRKLFAVGKQRFLSDAQAGFDSVREKDRFSENSGGWLQYI